MTALTGYHGTGKTVLLLSIEALFGYTIPFVFPPFIKQDASAYRKDAEFVDGVFEVIVETRDGRYSREVRLRDSASERRSRWRDALVDDAPLTDTWWPQYCGPVYAFSEMQGMSDHIRSESGLVDCERYDLSADELRGLKGVLGRQYDRVSVYRLSTDNLDGWDYPIPAVYAEWNGRVIDNRKMSIGELWVHYILWSLREMEDGGLALIDEPESHISARGQRALMDEVARYCLKKNLQLIVATHSPEILSRIPMQNTLMCVPSSEGAKIVRPTSVAQIQDTVGVLPRLKGIALVEDDAAATILLAIVNRFDVSLARELEIVSAGGEANVLAGLRSMRSAARVAVVGVLDGDQRTSGSDDIRLHFLPGTRTPETELLDLNEDGQIRLAERLGKSASDVSVALSNATMLDHQYQIPRFAAELAVPEKLLWHSLVLEWLQNREIQQMAMELVNSLRRLVDLHP
ncbi:AAA family ATPase [Micromonospora sp. NPDC049175]|uniref:AAA family ATPase n=1 Tax=Micromonospora sp. NPDC049175 TaxID=3364266 RepID=UPI00371D2CC3